MAERRAAKIRQKVVHRHRIGSQMLKRVSDFMLVRGEPKAVLRWIDIAGVRTPIAVDLDRAKLRSIRAGTSTLFLYAGTTTDPSAAMDPRPPLRGRRRTEDRPLPGGRRRAHPPT